LQSVFEVPLKLKLLFNCSNLLSVEADLCIHTFICIELVEVFEFFYHYLQNENKEVCRFEADGCIYEWRIVPITLDNLEYKL
jgi:hypothetical protein